MTTLIKLDLCKRQHDILVLMDSNHFITNQEIGDRLGIPAQAVADSLLALKKKIGGVHRLALTDAARKCGWLPYTQPADDGIEDRVRRLIAGNFPEGPLKELCVKAEALHCINANLATMIWLAHEQKLEVSIELLDTFQRLNNEAHAELNAVNEQITMMRKAVVM
jgi:DNA-binding CsgD family transcriptional regulator